MTFDRPLRELARESRDGVMRRGARDGRAPRTRSRDNVERPVPAGRSQDRQMKHGCPSLRGGRCARSLPAFVPRSHFAALCPFLDDNVQVTVPPHLPHPNVDLFIAAAFSDPAVDHCG